MMAGHEEHLGRWGDDERPRESYLVQVERWRVGHASVAFAHGISLATCRLFHGQHGNGETEFVSPEIR